VTVAEAISAVGFVLPALELIDSRIADWKIGLADTIADNASSGVVGWPGGIARAPTERSVSLSVHSALLIAFRLSRVPRPSGRTAWALDRGARTTKP
jgi:2-keto-4-pentenoate hydratase